MVPEWHLFPHIAQPLFHLWVQLEVDLFEFSCTNQCQHYYTLVNPLSLGVFGVECIQPSLDISGESYVSSSIFSSPGSIQVPSQMCHWSVQTSDSSGTLLDGGSLVSHHSQHVGKHFSSVSHDLIMDVLVGQVLKKSLLSLSLTLWLLNNMCCTGMVLFLMLSCSGEANSSIYN